MSFCLSYYACLYERSFLLNFLGVGCAGVTRGLPNSAFIGAFAGERDQTE